MRDRPRSSAFYALAAFFALFVAFLYGPTLTILVLSFQGPQGGLTFPMNGVSTTGSASSGRGSASSTSGVPCGGPCAWVSW